MKIVQFSKSSVLLEDPTNDNINLFLQFYIDKTPARAKEIIQCLKMNILNPYITNIYLLNEQIYDLHQFGIDDCSKIIQIDISKRLTYQTVFKYISDNQIHGYNVIVNSDILLDGTIAKIKYTDIHLNKKMYALLRYELNPTNMKMSRIFGPRFDSQDTWIIHSNFNIPPEQQKVFNFEFGIPGCDNKICYLANILGFEIYNDPQLIKTYHFHFSNIRNYSRKDVIKQPWGMVVPYNYHYTKCVPSLGIDLSVLYNQTNGFKQINFEDNTILYEYISNKFTEGKNFIIPRIGGLENEYALLGEYIMKNGLRQDYQKTMRDTIHGMKHHTGIKLTSVESVMTYSSMYTESFFNCDMYLDWESYGDVYKNYEVSIKYMRTKLNKQILWASIMDIYHYIFSNPWTHALRGKRVLIISSFEKSIQEKIPIREKIYGVDLFPDCELITICPPQTQGNNISEEFTVELERFTKELDNLEYDIALVSCGGYGNLVCNHIYTRGKSAIYVGGVLQMFFGIIGNRWFIDRPDIVRLFMNSHWSRPKDCEKPVGSERIEGGCYW
jgi:hypothetical protein